MFLLVSSSYLNFILLFVYSVISLILQHQYLLIPPLSSSCFLWQQHGRLTIYQQSRFKHTGLVLVQLFTR